MRSIARIDRILGKFNGLMRRYNLSFSDCLIKVCSWKRIPFYLEDDRFENLLDIEIELFDIQHANLAANFPNIPEDEVVLLMSQAWKKVPDWRFTQLIVNLFCDDLDCLAVDITPETIYPFLEA